MREYTCASFTINISKIVSGSSVCHYNHFCLFIIFFALLCFCVNLFTFLFLVCVVRIPWFNWFEEKFLDFPGVIIRLLINISRFTHLLGVVGFRPKIFLVILIAVFAAKNTLKVIFQQGPKVWLKTNEYATNVSFLFSLCNFGPLV